MNVAADVCPVCKRAHGWVQINDQPRTWLCDALTSETTVELPDGTWARRPRGTAERAKSGTFLPGEPKR